MVIQKFFSEDKNIGTCLAPSCRAHVISKKETCKLYNISKTSIAPVLWPKSKKEKTVLFAKHLSEVASLKVNDHDWEVEEERSERKS